MGLLDSILGRKQDVSSTDDVERRLKAEAGAGGALDGGEFKVEEVFKITGVGVIPVGEVLSGLLEPGFKCEQNGKTYEIKSIEMHHKQLKRAVQGDKVGINIKASDVEQTGGSLKGILAEIVSLSPSEATEISKGAVLRFHR